MDDWNSENKELNIYVHFYKPFGVESEFPFKLNEEDTFAMLKVKIAESFGIEPKNQRLILGKFKLSDIDDFNDSWKLNQLLFDHAKILLEAKEVNAQVSHGDFRECDLSPSFNGDYNPIFRVNEIREHIYTIPELLSQEECKSIIGYGESLGFEKLFNTNPNYRTNTRIVLSDPAFAQLLFQRIQKVVPDQRKLADESNWRISGLNTTFRLCKYTPGQFFKRHEDAYYAESENRTSFYTVNLYLNEQFEKGATRFFEADSEEAYAKVQPTTGRALIFEHFEESFPHDGEAVENGVKYLLRTDVMYERIQALEEDVEAMKIPADGGKHPSKEGIGDRVQESKI